MNTNCRIQPGQRRNRNTCGTAGCQGTAIRSLDGLCDGCYQKRLASQPLVDLGYSCECPSPRLMRVPGGQVHPDRICLKCGGEVADRSYRDMDAPSHPDSSNYD